jgi:hypothetical protein
LNADKVALSRAKFAQYVFPIDMGPPGRGSDRDEALERLIFVIEKAIGNRSSYMNFIALQCGCDYTPATKKLVHQGEENVWL